MTKIKIDISFRKSQGYWALIKVTNFKRKQSELHIILSPGKQIIQEKNGSMSNKSYKGHYRIKQGQFKEQTFG